MKSDFENQIEKRVAAHVREQMVEHDLGTNAMARKLKVQRSYISRLLNKSRGADAAFVARMHKELGISANVILDDNPPEQFWRLGPPPETMGNRPPSRRASPSSAHPTRQNAGSGGR